MSEISSQLRSELLREFPYQCSGLTGEGRRGPCHVVELPVAIALGRIEGGTMSVDEAKAMVVESAARLALENCPGLQIQEDHSFLALPYRCGQGASPSSDHSAD